MINSAVALATESNDFVPSNHGASVTDSYDAAWINADAVRFFMIITHDDHNSRYILARHDDSTWSEVSLRAQDVSQLHFDRNDHASYYLSHNGFIGKHRKIEQTRQVNAIMLDIDCHDQGFIDSFHALKSRLIEAFETGFLPRPTMLIDSGRGFHAYYVLEHSTPFRITGGGLNKHGLKFISDITHNLAHLYQIAIEEVPGAEVDRSVFDYARVARIPGSYNNKANRPCSFVFSDGTFWSLTDLARYRLPKLDTDDQSHKDTETSNIKEILSSKHSTRASHPSSRVIRFDAILVSRLRKVRELQEYRNFGCVGHRDNMCFVFYNTATQIYGPQRARTLLRQFNNNFITPLPSKDLDQIAQTVDKVVIKYGIHAGKKGFYPLSAQSIIDKLGLTDCEIAALNFFESKRAHDRALARQHTHDSRTSRNNAIISLYATGKFTQKEVAHKIGCSLRTVSSVLNQNDLALPQAFNEFSTTSTTKKKPAVENSDHNPSYANIFRCANNWHTSLGVEGLKDLGFRYGLGPVYPKGFVFLQSKSYRHYHLSRLLS